MRKLKNQISLKKPDFAKAVKTSVRSANEINLINRFDAVIDVSGFSYSDTLGAGESRHAYAWVQYCESRKIPYIFLPQAWGPFEEKETAFWAGKACQSAAISVSRDDVSSTHLAKLQGLPTDKIRQTQDIAFRFKGFPSTCGAAILRDLGFDARQSA